MLAARGISSSTLLRLCRASKVAGTPASRLQSSSGASGGASPKGSATPSTATSAASSRSSSAASTRGRTASAPSASGAAPGGGGRGPRRGSRWPSRAAGARAQPCPRSAAAGWGRRGLGVAQDLHLRRGRGSRGRPRCQWWAGGSPSRVWEQPPWGGGSAVQISADLLGRDHVT